MKYIREYQVFEASATASALTAEQIEWLDKCVNGSWKLNPQTGLINVDGNFYCSERGLTDFKGVRFGKVREHFVCGYNQLTTLEGAPKTVGGYFECENNELTSLVGAPQTVGGDFYCYDNQLTSLEGAPKTVKGDFRCYENELTTLVGAPKTVGGVFYCYDNPVSESTLKVIFALMKSGMGYQQALEEHWPKMADEDRVLMYKQMPNLSPEDARKYKALATYNNIKGYL